MSDLVGQPAPRLNVVRADPPSTIKALESLVMMAGSVLVVAALYLGRQIFVPIAIAVLLSFVLAPAVRMLRRWHVSRGLSVATVVLVAFMAIGLFGLVLARQVTQLAMDLPRYQQTIGQKIESVRGAATESTIIERASQALSKLGDQLSRARPTPSTEGAQPAPAPAAEPGTANLDPIPVEVHQPSPGPFDVLKTVIATVLEPLATTGIIVVFVIFILIQREDLRNRMIRLAGAQDLHRTTAAIDDAARRLSRYFLVQVALNAVFGVVVAVGLSIIGVPSPILWGMMAMFMRFVPYIGAFVAAAFPIALAAAVDPGWTMTFVTLALFVVSETIIGQVVEPLVYGHSTGLSPIAVVVAATFWTWLWGPVGLLLATPLTACLVVMGRHVERLQFLDVLFGDTPPLSPVESLYQRLLAGDEAEALEQAERHLSDQPLSDFYDSVALESLLLAQQDTRRGTLDVDRQRKIRDTVAALIEDLDDIEDRQPERAEPEPAFRPQPGQSQPTSAPVAVVPPSVGVTELAPQWRSPAKILVVSGRGPLDEAAAQLLGTLLEKHGLAARVVAADAFSTELDPSEISMVCLCYLDVDASRAQVRFALRRLRRRIPDAPLLACFWMVDGENDRLEELCEVAGGDACASSLVDAVTLCVEFARGTRQRVATPALAADVA